MHILVIEDNRDLTANLYDFLEARGHTVDAAYDGRSGLAFALERRFDAVVLDLMLPALDGLAVCSELRAAGNDTPVLMLTARDTLDDKLVGFARGADDYLVKPFALQELEARLAALVRRAGGGTAPRRLQVADLVLEPDVPRITRAGQEITLPPIPLKILTVLMRQPNKVVTRQELERAVWGDSPPDSDSLRAHLYVLRAAVDRPFPTHLIHTVHGIGYRLEGESVDHL